MRIAANKTGDKSDKDNKSKDDTRKCGLSYFSESRVNVKFLFMSENCSNMVMG